ncbi:MAG: PEP-CTERM sorting domain-containing protein [Gemmatimonadales bacterium]
MRKALHGVTTLLALSAMATPKAAESQLTPVDPACDYTVWLIDTMEIFNPNPTACAGAFAGNDVQQVSGILSEIANQGWGTGASYLGTTDAGQTSGPFSYVGDGVLGVLTFDSPLTGDYVVALKASRSFSLYYFAGLVNQSSIFYNTVGTAQNKHGVPQDLSHASLFSLRTVTVPEPGQLALLVTGLLGLGFAAARRRRDAAA